VKLLLAGSHALTCWIDKNASQLKVLTKHVVHSQLLVRKDARLPSADPLLSGRD